MHCIDVAYCYTCHTFHDLCVCVYIVHTVEPCKNALANGAVVCMQFDPRLSWCPPFLFYSKFSDYSHSWWQQIKRYTGQLKPCELYCLANGYLKQLADAANSLLRLPVNSGDFLMEEYTVSACTVFCQLQRINVWVALSPDGLSNWILHSYALLLCDPFYAIFNASIHLYGKWLTLFWCLMVIHRLLCSLTCDQSHWY